MDTEGGQERPDEILGLLPPCHTHHPSAAAQLRKVMLSDPEHGRCDMQCPIVREAFAVPLKAMDGVGFDHFRG